MRRNWDCIRALLLETEKLEPTMMVAPGQIKGFSEDEVLEHIRLICEAGFCEGYPKTNPMFIERLTWKGHELLDIMRSQTLWQRIKAEAKDRGIALGFEVIKSLAEKLIKGG